MDDNHIVDLFLLRDETAINEAAKKYGSRLRSLAYGITKDIQTAEECENDTWLRAWNSIPPNEPRSYMYAYLARITRHLALNCCRDRSRLKRRQLVESLTREMEQCIPGPKDVESRMDDIMLTEAINGFLASLDEDKRNVFIRRYWYLDSISDISRRFGWSESKITSMLFRLRIRLRDHLEKEGYLS